MVGEGINQGAAVEVAGLRRTYASSTGFIRRKELLTEAIRGIDLHVARGELFGILGPNGAGKTTTIKVLTTLLIPTAGTVSVLGLDVVRDARELRRKIGYVFGGERGLYERLSARDNLRYFAELYGVDPGLQRRRIDQLFEMVGLSGRENERVEGYSRGMRQRVHVARGLIHDPPIVFLDEPTIGLDPVGARELRALIASLTAAGKTVVMTTHYMFEADALCGRIAVINRGEIVAEGTPAQLKAAVSDRSVIDVETDGVPGETLERLRALPGVGSVGVEEREHQQLLSIQMREARPDVQRVMAVLEAHRVSRVTTREPTLEDAYVALVTRA